MLAGCFFPEKNMTSINQIYFVYSEVSCKAGKLPFEFSKKKCQWVSKQTELILNYVDVFILMNVGLICFKSQCRCSATFLLGQYL